MDKPTELSLRDRLDLATESPNKWNNWPDKLAFVQIERFALDDAKSAYKGGLLLGRASASGACRQIPPANLPFEIGTKLGLRPSHPMLQVAFCLDNPRGQGDDRATRNILALFEIVAGGDYRASHVISVEIGCVHDYDTAGSRMCYAQGTCKKCGHRWICDSSD